MKLYILLFAYYIAYAIQHIFIFVPYYLWHGEMHKRYDSNRKAFIYHVKEVKIKLGYYSF